MKNLNDMLAQVKKLKTHGGIKYLLDEAAKILGNPIVMFNTEYDLIAHTECITDDLLWNEIITHGTFSKETQKFFECEGFVEEVANTSNITMLSSEKLKYDRISGKLFNKNNSHVSNIVMVACNKNFDEHDYMIFEIICKLLSKEISKSDFYQKYEQEHQETIIKNLIEGNIDIGQVSILYDSLESNIYIAVADMSQYKMEQNISSFRDILKQIKPEYKYAIYSFYIIIIISTENEVLDVNKEMKELIKFFQKNQIYIGISGRFENLFELRKYYAEALKSLQYILESKSDQFIFPYNEQSIKTMEQIISLKSGTGIQYLLNIGPEIFDNPLLFHDMELNLLGYTEDVEIIDPIWKELITYGTSSSETINLFKTEGFIQTMENTKGGAILISEKIKYDRISWRIYSKDNIMIGCLSIVNTVRPFSEDELVLFGAFGQIFSKEVSKMEFYNHYGQLYSGTVINRLISGKIDDYTFYSEDIGNLYDNLMKNLYLIVVDTSNCKENVNLTYFKNLFNWSDAVNRFAIYEDRIIIIISIENLLLDENKKFKEISKVFEEKNIYAGISSCFENIYDLQKHYIEVIKALDNGMKELRIGKHIFSTVEPS